MTSVSLRPEAYGADTSFLGDLGSLSPLHPCPRFASHFRVVTVTDLKSAFIRLYFISRIIPILAYLFIFLRYLSEFLGCVHSLYFSERTEFCLFCGNIATGSAEMTRGWKVPGKSGSPGRPWN